MPTCSKHRWYSSYAKRGQSNNSYNKEYQKKVPPCVAGVGIVVVFFFNAPPIEIGFRKYNALRIFVRAKFRTNNWIALNVHHRYQTTINIYMYIYYAQSIGCTNNLKNETKHFDNNHLRWTSNLRCNAQTNISKTIHFIL